MKQMMTRLISERGMYMYAFGSAADGRSNMDNLLEVDRTWGLRV